MKVFNKNKYIHPLEIFYLNLRDNYSYLKPTIKVRQNYIKDDFNGRLGNNFIEPCLLVLLGG